MYERTRSRGDCTAPKIVNDIGPRKTMFVLVVVVGCFAILWPKVFYPMLVGSANKHMKPSPIDKTTGCCDVFSETDMDTIKIMSELCSSIIQQSGVKPLSGKEIVTKCKTEIQQTCGIDISAVLQEQIRLGRSVKQILNEIRSLNGSLCLKYHYGVAPWRLGVPHRITINFTTNIRQERPPHMRPDIVHPAFRERGSAIPRPAEPSKKQPKVVEGRPGPLPGMRPTLGGAGHVVPPSQKGSSSMSVIMPIYTIGIVIFFTYTLMKLLFKKQPDGVGGSLYPPIEPDSRFRKEVFESERCRFTPRLSRDPTGKIVVNAVSALLDEVDGEIEARRKANGVAKQAKHSAPHTLANGSLANGNVPKHEEHEQTSVKILGMETTASCEGGEKWNKPAEPFLAVPHPVEPQAPPQEIYLEGALPAQSQILVADSAVVTESAPSDTNSDPAVVLAGKMTLSVISLDSILDNDKDAEVNDALLEEDLIDDLVEVNGETENMEEDPIEESKYTTASSATVAETEISDEGGTDNEEVDEDIEKITDLELEINHVPYSNGSETNDEIKQEVEEALTPEMQEMLRQELEDVLREEFEDEPKQEIKEGLKLEVKNELKQEELLQQTIEPVTELQQAAKEGVTEVKENLDQRTKEEEPKQEVKDWKQEKEKELKVEAKTDLLQGSNVGLKEVQKELKQQFIDELEQETKEELVEKVAEELIQTIENTLNERAQEKLVEKVTELKQTIVDGTQNELTQEVENELKQELKLQPTKDPKQDAQENSKQNDQEEIEEEFEEDEDEEIEEIEVEEEEEDEEEEEIEEIEIEDDEVEEIEIEVDEDVEEHKKL